MSRDIDVRELYLLVLFIKIYLDLSLTNEFIVAEEPILISVITWPQLAIFIFLYLGYFHKSPIFIEMLCLSHTRCFNKANAHRSDELPVRWTVSFGFEYRLYG